MGLFDKVFKKQEKQNEEKRDVLPLVIKTDNVSKSLQEISKNYNIPVSQMDFDLLSYQTYIKFGEESDFVDADEESIKQFTEDRTLINEDVLIKQSYEIKVRKYQFLDEFELLGKVAVSKDLTLAKYIVSPKSLLFYEDWLKDMLIEELNKKKLKNRFLINILDDEMREGVETLVAKIRVLGELEKSEEIVLCRAKSPVNSIDAKIIEHYKNSVDYDEFGDKIDFKKKSMVYPVKENELLIEFLKPIKGVNGRNCRGEVILAKEPKEIEFPKYILGKGVERKEEQYKIEFIATKNGYLSFEDDKISVKDELEVRQINLKTGSVTGAEENDVKMEVTENNHLKEAIADGMMVETTDLLVKGNVGNGARVKTKKVVIEGQTHRKSKIISREAEINIHRGYLKAVNATIHRLESGIVDAEKVHILQAVGGKVRAMEIKIDVLGSHVTLISSHLIEVESVRGGENHLIISPSILGDVDEEIAKLEEKIVENERGIRALKEKFLKNREIVMKNKTAIADIKKKILKNRENGIKTNPQLSMKVKKFNELVSKTKEMDRKIKVMQDNIHIYKNRIEDLQIGIFGAKIIFKSEIKAYNRLEFKMIEPPMEIIYDTKEDDMSGVYKLVEVDEMVYEIKREGKK